MKKNELWEKFYFQFDIDTDGIDMENWSDINMEVNNIKNSELDGWIIINEKNDSQ